jgi:hypothetical protein
VLEAGERNAREAADFSSAGQKRLASTTRRLEQGVTAHQASLTGDAGQLFWLDLLMVVTGV